MTSRSEGGFLAHVGTELYSQQGVWKCYKKAFTYGVLAAFFSSDCRKIWMTYILTIFPTQTLFKILSGVIFHFFVISRIIALVWTRCKNAALSPMMMMILEKTGPGPGLRFLTQWHTKMLECFREKTSSHHQLIKTGGVLIVSLIYDDDGDVTHCLFRVQLVTWIGLSLIMMVLMGYEEKQPLKNEEVAFGWHDNFEKLFKAECDNA